ncbi:hypothetical protein ACJ2CR_04320 [Myxococcus faecalis]|uniref:hypothetical protein n=1 Tax=Myxococcus faecalis TaxID=3115646 RepID=UPI0038CF7140
MSTSGSKDVELVNSTAEVWTVRPKGSWRATSAMTTPSGGSLPSVVGMKKLMRPGVATWGRPTSRRAVTKAWASASPRSPCTVRRASAEAPIMESSAEATWPV